jgi:CHAT domain-containing protein
LLALALALGASAAFAADSTCPVPRKVASASVEASAQASSGGAVGASIETAAGHLAAGRIDKATELLGRLVADPSLSPSDRALAQSLLAVARSAGGEIKESVRLAKESVLASRSTTTMRTRSAISTNAALAITESGDAKTARTVLQSAAADAAAAGDRGLEAIALVDLALLESRAGADPTPVADRAQKAVAALASASDRAPLYASLGIALLANADDPSKAGARATRADEMLALSYRDASQSRRHLDMAIALGLSGELRGQRGEPKAAIEALDRAVAISRAAGDDPWRYRWLWQLGKARAATGDTEGARRDLEKAVAELEAAKLSRALGRSSSGALARNYRGAYLDLADLLLAPEGTLDEKRLVQARDLLERSRTAEIEDYFRDPCVAASARRTAQIESVDASVAVVYPISFASRTEILVGHQSGFTRFRSPVGVTAIAREAQRLRAAVESPGSDRYRRPAERLDEWLVKPIAAHLAKLGVKTLVWVPDGPLRGVPFAALHDGQTFLVQRYAIAVTPVASLVDPRPLGATSRRAVLTGLTEARGGFDALPSVADELTSLSAIFGTPSIRDASFTMAALSDALSRAPAAVVHVATHGQFAPDNADTFLLTYDGRLTLPQLREALAASKLREEPVELLTLSACQTAVGDERAALGLAGVALSSGARSALATLWSVNDESTALLIGDFYTRLVKSGESKAQALRAAQIALVNNPTFSHPAFWAPFILIGNWM